MDRFLAGYFPLLSDYVKEYIAPDNFIEELMIGTRAMIENTDKERTNRDIFWEVFCSRTDLDCLQFEPHVAKFYEDEFYKLEGLSQRKSAAKGLVEYCFNQEMKVAIATNPLFPMSAIKQRLKWAGVPTDKYNYSIVTAYENMHAAKPHAAYYEEILKAIDVSADEALMVGDNWNNDMVPTAALGIKTYWITEVDEVDSKKMSIIDGYGSLESLRDLLTTDWLPD